MPDKEDQLYKWTGLKYILHSENKGIKTFREGEIWWTACGENVGVEINGKSNVFSRPVIIFKRINQYSFVGIPTTSREKTGNWYVKICFHQHPTWAVLAQQRTFSVNRLYTRIGRLDEYDLLKLKLGLKEFLEI